MSPTQAIRKRKDLSELTEVSDDEFDGTSLEGILSQSEDDSEDDGSTGFDGFDSLDDEDNSDINGDLTDPEDYDDAATNPSEDGESDDQKPNYRVVTDANGGERYEYDEVDPVYDSDDSDAQGPANTIGNIPLSFYDSYPHIGYDINGKKIMRPATGEALDALLDSIELPKGWTGLTDPETGKPLNLSQDELELLRRLQMGEVPEEGFDPYADMVPYFTSIEEEMPISAAPEPKRRFVPSKHEAKRIAQLVRAIKDGRILPYKPPKTAEEETDEPDVQYDIWANEESKDAHVMNIPAPKLAPPGYDLSYNPPQEYLPTAEEAQAWEATDPEERAKDYLPARFDSLRKVPGYGQFVKERFERCLDLYLAPRIRKNKLNIDPNSLLPKLPRPEELKPFPTVCQTIFNGHEGRVRSVAFSPDGEWVASGGDDGTVRVWAINGHQEWMVRLASDEPVNTVRWRPNKETFILAAAAGEDMFFIVPPLCSDAVDSASRAILDAGFGYAANSQQSSQATSREAAGKWSRPGSKLEEAGVLLTGNRPDSYPDAFVAQTWGLHLLRVPTGQRSSVAIHTILTPQSNTIPSTARTGTDGSISPLPSAILCRNAAHDPLLRSSETGACESYTAGARWISSMDIHTGGDNLIVGSYDRRLLWHDLDLSNRPYKTMRFHSEAIRAVKYHRSLPLFADASDDGSLQIFHGKVVSDLMENATIVPVKMLKGHSISSKLGVMDLDWHPRHPWCISAGADGTCRLWT